MIFRYLLAFILTILLLGFARRTSTRHSSDLKTQVDGVTLEHRTITENFGDSPELDVRTSNADGIRAVVLYSQEPGSGYGELPMSAGPDGFHAALPALPKGKKWFYHIEFFKENVEVAQLPNGHDQFIKFKGHLSPAVLIPHIFFMFATIFFGILTVLSAIDYNRGRGELLHSVRFLLLTLISAFLGGFPFGIAVTYQTFGGGWGGYPIGRDWTDTKTEIFFAFWLVTFLLARKGLVGGKMPISNRTYSFLTILSFVVTFITFLIPHSI
jgi:hypothetical protein